MVSVGKVFSILGNPDSLVPLMIKDTASTTGMTVGSYITGKEEGHDRLIDEVGTEVIWLGGLPFFKWLYDKTAFKALGLDAKFDARNFNNKFVLQKIKEYAPTEDVKKEISKITKKSALFKNAATAKFITSTVLTVGSYMGLTKFKQNYTEKKIRENLIAEYKSEQEKNKSTEKINKEVKTPSFKGLGALVQNFAFSDVKNMWILDGCITAERLKDSRSEQEFIGYAIKEASILTFMYYAGGKIQEKLEKEALKKHNKTISLDARVYEDGFLQKAFEDGSIEKSIKEFNEIAKKSSSSTKNLDDAVLYEFLYKNPDNLIVKSAKMSDIISEYKTVEKSFLGIPLKFKKTDKIDTRKYIDLEEMRDSGKKIETLYNQYKEALSKGETSEQFFKKVKKLKRNSILTNIGSCIFALGILTPAIMLLRRYTSNDNQEFETKKRIRNQLIKEGIIA